VLRSRGIRRRSYDRGGVATNVCVEDHGTPNLPEGRITPSCFTQRLSRHFLAGALTTNSLQLDQFFGGSSPASRSWRCWPAAEARHSVALSLDADAEAIGRACQRVGSQTCENSVGFNRLLVGQLKERLGQFIGRLLEDGPQARATAPGAARSIASLSIPFFYPDLTRSLEIHAGRDRGAVGDFPAECQPVPEAVVRRKRLSVSNMAGGGAPSSTSNAAATTASNDEGKHALSAMRAPWRRPVT